MKKKRTKRKLKLHLVFSCERLILFFFVAFFFLGLFNTMRLLTHNLLMCNKRGCTSDHFPMKIKPTKIVVEESEFNPEEVRAMYSKLDWAALVSGAKDVCFFLFPFMHPPTFTLTFLSLHQCGQTIPSEPPTEAQLADEAFLKALHDIIFDVCICSLTTPQHSQFTPPMETAARCGRCAGVHKLRS